MGDVIAIIIELNLSKCHVYACNCNVLEQNVYYISGTSNIIEYVYVDLA